MDVDWLKYRELRRGRDPLGVQAININLYSFLMPGITNATNRLRYYSFYPWLLKQFRKDSKELDFVSFLRRSEFLFGLISNFNHRSDPDYTTRMVGSDTIVKAILELEDNHASEFIKYTTLENTALRYLKNELGGFGQAYFGQLSLLGILTHKERNVFSLLPRGSDLADCFASKESALLFLKSVQIGKVTVTDLENMHDDFCVCSITKNKSEYDFLNEYIFGPDENFVDRKSYKKKDTLILLNYLLSNIPDPTTYWELLNMLYYEKNPEKQRIRIPDSLNSICKSWRYYVRHEYFSIGLTCLFVGIQHVMKGNFHHEEEVAQSAWESLIRRTKLKEFPLFLNKPFALIKKDLSVFETVERMKTIYSDRSPFSAEALSEFNIEKNVTNKSSSPDFIFVCGVLLILFSISRIEKKENISVDEINQASYFLRYPINLTRLHNDYFGGWKNLHISIVMKEIITKYVLRQHMEVAFKKLLTDGLSTFRFLKEDSIYCLSGMEVDRVVRTNPRLSQSLQALSDLNVIKESKDGFHLNNARSDLP